MKARHRLTRRHQHDGKQGVKKTADFTIDSDTFMFVHTPYVNYNDETLLLLGSGGDFTGGARPVFKADLSDADKWGINTNDTILSATLTVFADSIAGSAGTNDPHHGDPDDYPYSLTFPGIPAKLLTVDLTTWNEILHGGDTHRRATPVSYAPYPVVVYSHRPDSPNHPAIDRLNWNNYAGGQNWTLAGAEDTTDDINVSGYAEFELGINPNLPNDPGDDAMYEIDVTEHAKYAMSSRDSEFCVQMYRGSDDTGDNNENLTRLYSVNHVWDEFRPKLTITYLDRS